MAFPSVLGGCGQPDQGAFYGDRRRVWVRGRTLSAEVRGYLPGALRGKPSSERSQGSFAFSLCPKEADPAGVSGTLSLTNLHSTLRKCLLFLS